MAIIKISLHLICYAYTLGIPSPKTEMDGSMVGHAYWEENKLEEIKQYCERDVVTVAQIYLRLNTCQY
jgi:predicted PolB exonuclease-like 3'-5' exonuclease